MCINFLAFDFPLKFMHVYMISLVTNHWTVTKFNLISLMKQLSPLDKYILHVLLFF